MKREYSEMNNKMTNSIENALSSDQLSTNQLISNQHNQNQIDQQIEDSIDETQLNREEDQTLVHDSETIDLLISSQKLRTEFFFFNKKRKTKKERQITLKKNVI